MCKKKSFFGGMLKKSGFLVITAATMVVASVFVSCSSDDEGEEETFLTPPAAAQYSKKYEITSVGSDIASIELTESGNYIITPRMNMYTVKGDAVKRTKARFMQDSRKVLKRENYTNYIYGKYTRIGENEYYLEGYGRIKVHSEGENAVSLTIQKDGQNEYVLTAAVANQKPESLKTSMLCRTWKIDKMRVQAYVNGRKVWDKTASVDRLEDLMPDGEDGDFEYEDIPQQVVFTRAGTYMVYYNNGAEGEELSVSTWAWADENSGLLRYSWDYDSMYDDEMSGEVSISFAGSTMSVTEQYIEIDEADGEEYKEILTTICSEVR